MLDKLFLRYLTKKGKIIYWVGQVILAILWFLYVIGIGNESFDSDNEIALILGILGIIVGWGFVCLMIWKKPKES